MSHTAPARRPVVAALGILGLGAAVAGRSAAPAWATPRFGSDPFALGVASGDPWPDGFVLWTRLAADPLAADGLGGLGQRRIQVRWEVAEDERFTRVVRRGTSWATPELGYSVHVELHGLRPRREYHYRFQTGGVVSPTGRTRTAPAPGDRVESLRFATASCQAWQDGLFTAHQHLAAEDLDVVFFLGDYIYEAALNATGGQRRVPVPEHVRPEPMDLTQYRLRHALHRLDPDLRAAHQAHPWVAVWDDHEVEDNWAGDRSRVDTEPDQDPAVFRQRRAAAFQAYYEHLPLRLPNRPRGAGARLYRSLDFGRLARFNVLDTRLFRSDQACGDGAQTDCADRLSRGRTVLGADQEHWLYRRLDSSHAIWNVIPQQMIMAQCDIDPGPAQKYFMDIWDGYTASRDRLLTHLARARVSNPVVLTGDVHRHFAAELRSDFDDPDSTTLGVELVCSSIASGRDGADLDEHCHTVLDNNPHFRFANAQRGYLVNTMTPQMLRTDFRVVPYISRPGAGVSTRTTLVTESGRPGLQPG